MKKKPWIPVFVSLFLLSLFLGSSCSSSAGQEGNNEPVSERSSEVVVNEQGPSEPSEPSDAGGQEVLPEAPAEEGPEVAVDKALPPNGPFFAQAPGGSSDGMAVDADGNIYIIGSFKAPAVAEFGSTRLTSKGSRDIFVAKLDRAGNWLWAKRAGGPDSDGVRDIVLDSEGHVYITGSFRQTADFGSTSLTAKGRSNGFLAKLDKDGKWLWAKNMIATASSWGASARALAVDAEDNLYLAGSFGGGATIGDSANLTAKGLTDAFVAKLDKDGKLLWAKRAGGDVRADSASSVAVDSSGNVVLGGTFRGTADFGSISLTDKGNDDVFVAKLDKDGKWLWAKRAGGAGEEIGNAQVDHEDNILVVGGFSETADFGSTNLTSKGERDLFVAKLDKDGKWLWVNRAGGPNSDGSTSMVSNSSGELFLTGSFLASTVDFGSTNLTSKGVWDAFVAKLDKDGKWLWARRAGGTMIDNGSALLLDGDGYIVVSGYFEGSADFDNTSHTAKSPAGALFVWKFAQPK